MRTLTEQRRRGSGADAASTWLSAAFPAGLLPFPAVLAQYAIVAFVGTALFFFLHHLGNQIPYQLAEHRLSAAEHRDSSHIRPGNLYNGPYVYCEISLPILKMAERRAAGENPFLDAIALKTLGRKGSPCSRLKAALNGVEQEEFPFKARYWWGSRALFAIALRHFSAAQVRELLEAGTYAAYALLALFLLRLSPKTLLVVSPLVLYGGFFSGIRYFSDIVNGAPSLWAVLSASALALLMRRQASNTLAAVRLFCFFTGMVSCFLWLGEGHAFLAMTLIGMVTYFGGRHLDRPAAAVEAASCISLYLVGFAVCYATGFVVKAALQDGVWEEFWNQVIHVFSKQAERTPSLLDTWRQYLGMFHFMAMGKRHVLAAELLTFFSLFALLASAAFAALGIFARTGGEKAAANGGRIPSAGRRFQPSQDILWILGLLVVNVPNFAIYDDIPARSASFLFVPFGLCASGLILVLLSMNGRGLLVLCGSLLASTAAFLLYVKIEEQLFVNRIESSEPIVRSAFDLYLFDDQLVYVKDRCADWEVDRRFYLDVLPHSLDDLSGDPWWLGYEELDFIFPSRYYSYQHAIRSGKCVLVRPLLGYEVSCIQASQGHWEAAYCGDDFKRRQQRVLAAIEEASPIIRSRFDVYRIGNELIYLKDQCTKEDRAATFFLHATPLNEAGRRHLSQGRDFVNLDFRFYPTYKDASRPRRCLAARPLPEYEVASIWTGQFAGGERLWEGEFHQPSE